MVVCGGGVTGVRWCVVVVWWWWCVVVVRGGGAWLRCVVCGAWWVCVVVVVRGSGVQRIVCFRYRKNGCLHQEVSCSMCKSICLIDALMTIQTRKTLDGVCTVCLILEPTFSAYPQIKVVLTIYCNRFIDTGTLPLT